MKLYANKRFLCSMRIAEEDELLDSETCYHQALKGELLLKDYNGREFPVTEEYFQNNYVEVEIVEDKHKYDMNELANGYAALSELNQEEDQDYINGMEKIVKDKAF